MLHIGKSEHFLVDFYWKSIEFDAKKIVKGNNIILHSLGIWRRQITQKKMGCQVNGSVL